MATEKQKTAARQNLKKARASQSARAHGGKAPSSRRKGLSTAEQNDLSERQFAFPKERKEPLTDARHVRNAIARFDQVEGVTDAGLPPAHVGLHAGPVLFQEGDYFGQTVNVASRIAEYARQGEVLVSQAVVDASSGADATFTDIGPVELKGVSGTIQLLAAHRGASPA